MRMARFGLPAAALELPFVGEEFQEQAGKLSQCLTMPPKHQSTMVVLGYFFSCPFHAHGSANILGTPTLNKNQINCAATGGGKNITIATSESGDFLEQFILSNLKLGFGAGKNHL